MKNNTENLLAFSKVIWGVAEEFGGRISDDSMELRFNAMREYSIEQITQAGTWIIKNRKKTFPPVPTTKEFIDAIDKLCMKIDEQTQAGIQADLVLSELKFKGSGGDVNFSDPITNHLMSNRWAFVSWGRSLMEKEIVWWRKEFVDAYLQFDANSEALCLSQDKISCNGKTIEFKIKSIKGAK